MKERLIHDAMDASRMFAAAFLGWTVTSADLGVVLKVTISAATLVYMVGKAVTVWYHLLKERNTDRIPPENDD
jgi:hypothetical protein